MEQYQMDDGKTSETVASRLRAVFCPSPAFWEQESSALSDEIRPTFVPGPMCSHAHRSPRLDMKRAAQLADAKPCVPEIAFH